MDQEQDNLRKKNTFCKEIRNDRKMPSSSSTHDGTEESDTNVPLLNPVRINKDTSDSSVGIDPLGEQETEFVIGSRRPHLNPNDPTLPTGQLLPHEIVPEVEMTIKDGLIYSIPNIETPVHSIDSEDESENEWEETYLYVDLEDIPNVEELFAIKPDDFLIACQSKSSKEIPKPEKPTHPKVQFRFHNFDTDKPVLQIGDRFYEGTVEEPFGTSLFFRQKPKISTNTTIDPKPSTNTTIDPKPSTNTTIDPKPSTNTTIDSKPSTNTTIDPKPSTNTTIDPKPSTNTTIDPKPSTNTTIDPKPSTSKQNLNTSETPPPCEKSKPKSKLKKLTADLNPPPDPVFGLNLIPKTEYELVAKAHKVVRMTRRNLQSTKSLNTEPTLSGLPPVLTKLKYSTKFTRPISADLSNLVKDLPHPITKESKEMEFIFKRPRTPPPRSLPITTENLEKDRIVNECEYLVMTGNNTNQTE